MIEAGEPLHIFGIVFFLIIIALLIGIQIGLSENEHKKAD